MENSPLRSFSVQLRSSFIPAVPRKETRVALRHPGNLARVESSRCLESGSFHPRAQMLPSVLCARRVSEAALFFPTSERLIHSGRAPELLGRISRLPLSLCHVERLPRKTQVCGNKGNGDTQISHCLICLEEGESLSCKLYSQFEPEERLNSKRQGQPHFLCCQEEEKGTYKRQALTTLWAMKHTQ